MAHLINAVIAILGAGLVTVLSGALSGALFGGLARTGPSEVLTGCLGALLVWGLLEAKDAGRRRAVARVRREGGAVRDRPA